MLAAITIVFSWMLNLLFSFSPYLSVIIPPASSRISLDAAISMILLPLRSMNASYLPLATYEISSTTLPSTLILLALSTRCDAAEVPLFVNPPRVMSLMFTVLLGCTSSLFSQQPFPFSASKKFPLPKLLIKPSSTSFNVASLPSGTLATAIEMPYAGISLIALLVPSIGSTRNMNFGLSSSSKSSRLNSCVKIMLLLVPLPNFNSPISSLTIYERTGAFFSMFMTFSSAIMSMNDVGVPSAPIFTFSPDSGFPT